MLVALVILVLVGGVALWDTVSNWNRAYGNISINGVNVGGMNPEEMNQTLHSTFGPRVSSAQVVLYGNEEAKEKGEAALSAAQQAIAEGSAIEDQESLGVVHWMVDALSLKAEVPYQQAIDAALAIGRSEGGFFERLSLASDPVDIPLGVNFDHQALEDLALQIDESTGNPRKDTTVEIHNAWATAVEGHDGTMVDREWLARKISDAMILESEPLPIVMEYVDAPSRITMAQAEELVDQLNHALGCEADFTYKDNRFHATDIDLGDWTVVSTVPDGEGFKLGVSIDSSLAIPAISKGAEAHVTAEDTTVTFREEGSDIIVTTGGPGKLPQVSPAVGELQEALYGESGIAWSNEEPYNIAIEIGETDKPETLTLNEAMELDIVSPIGEFTTEFSNYVGTENRNHNIKLAADILNNRIVDANGGIWSFNDESGDTNEAAGFWSAGSIVDGEITDSIGGGICQVATTIFNAVYEAGLDIPTRHNHTLYMANYPDGRDAAVTYPEMDLVWRNNFDSDVLLRLSYTDSSITATVYGVYTGYVIETVTGDWKEGKKYSTRFNEDPNLAKGAYYLKTSGHDGKEINVTRIIKDKNGNVLDYDNFASVYLPQDEIYVVGPGTDTKPLEKKEEDEKEEEDTQADEAAETGSDAPTAQSQSAEGATP